MERTRRDKQNLRGVDLTMVRCDLMKRRVKKKGNSEEKEAWLSLRYVERKYSGRAKITDECVP